MSSSLYRDQTKIKVRDVASLTVPAWQEFYFPHFFLKFWSIFLIFPQTLLIFFLILALRVGESPTQKGPGYITNKGIVFEPTCVSVVWYNMTKLQLQVCCST